MQVGDIVKPPPRSCDAASKYGAISHFAPSRKCRTWLRVTVATQHEDGVVRDLSYDHNDDAFVILVPRPKYSLAKGDDVVFMDAAGWREATVMSVEAEMVVVEVPSDGRVIKNKGRNIKILVDPVASRMKRARLVADNDDQDGLNELLDSAVQARVRGPQLEWERAMNSDLRAIGAEYEAEDEGDDIARDCWSCAYQEEEELGRASDDDDYIDYCCKGLAIGEGV